MVAVQILAITPERGPTSGSDLVRLTTTAPSDSVEVLFDGHPAHILAVRQDGDRRLVDLRTPAHGEGDVDVVLRALDTRGQPIPGQSAVLPGAYRYERPRIARESNLARLVRALLRELKRQVIENASITVALDYDDTPDDGLRITAVAQIPSLTLAGPRVSENRFYATNQPREEVVPGSDGLELRRRRPPLTVDLAFTITAASDRTVELLNLMAAVASFLNRNRWLELARDPADPAAGTVRWEMDPEGEFRTRLDGPGDIRAFTCGLVVRGFDIDEGLPMDVGKPVAETSIDTNPITRPDPP